MNICLNCETTTNNPKFCSRRCATTYNNKQGKFPKRKPEGSCKRCGRTISTKYTYCIDCSKQVQSEKAGLRWETVTYGEAKAKRKYQSNSRIRALAKNKYHHSNRPQYCLICGYDTHFHVCHIKGISTFPPETKVSEINNIENLIALCPNCHWEFDHNIMDKEVLWSALKESNLSLPPDVKESG